MLSYRARYGRERMKELLLSRGAFEIYLSLTHHPSLPNMGLVVLATLTIPVKRTVDTTTRMNSQMMG